MRVNNESLMYYSIQLPTTETSSEDVHIICNPAFALHPIETYCLSHQPFSIQSTYLGITEIAPISCNTAAQSHCLLRRRTYMLAHGDAVAMCTSNVAQELRVLTCIIACLSPEVQSRGVWTVMLVSILRFVYPSSSFIDTEPENFGVHDDEVSYQ